MKKALILIIVLSLTTVALTAAVAGTGSLNVYGKIVAGDITFSVNQILESTSRIDLIDNVDVQPTGNGVTVGSWEFDAVNQGSAAGYTLTYTYDALTEGTTDIAYELLVSDGTTANALASGDTTTFTATTGNYNIDRTVLVRLTSAGAAVAAGAPASSNYNSTIDLELTTP
ncbi:MAG: hypothetical protein JXK93_00790 [Sphaerochaetaceae bacterium]|nr:hypothetical protein [Sphaerochaetaceae bacterium]